jgi:hypothetical protein
VSVLSAYPVGLPSSGVDDLSFAEETAPHTKRSPGPTEKKGRYHEKIINFYFLLLVGIVIGAVFCNKGTIDMFVRS